MTQQRLNHVMLLHTYKDRTDLLDLDAIAKKVMREGPLSLSTIQSIIQLKIAKMLLNRPISISIIALGCDWAILALSNTELLSCSRKAPYSVNSTIWHFATGAFTWHSLYEVC